MPRALDEATVDPAVNEVDEALQADGNEPVVPQHRFNAQQHVGDLADGGQVGAARVVPLGDSGRVDFKQSEPGRPTVRRVWSWNGVPGTIPLAYEPSGKRHDGGRRYLLKRHCVVCNYSGFYGQFCPACRKEGRELAPPVPAFYLKFSQVPQPGKFFGNVDCFVPACVRRGRYGFLDEPTMRQHAMGKHRMEYRAFQDAQQSSSAQRMAALEAQLAALTAAALQRPAPVAEAPALAAPASKPARTAAQLAHTERLKAAALARRQPEATPA